MQNSVNAIEINEIVNERLRVKPLEENEFATYKLCEVDNVDYSRIDEKTGKPKQNSPRRALKKQETITDPFDKKQKIIQNIVGTKFDTDEKGNQRAVAEVERVNFPRTGALTLNFNHQGTYAFLERHPRNRDNPFRDKSKIPVFYRVNNKKRAVEEIEKHYLLSDAMEWVKKADINELKSIYENLDPTSKEKIGTSELEIMRRDMFRLAQSSPMILLKASNNKMSKWRIQIMDAEYFQIISFFDIDEMGVNNKRQWVFTGKKDEVICELEISQNRYDGLIEYFDKKDAKGKRDEKSVNSYKRLTEELKKILQPRGVPVAVKASPLQVEVLDNKGQVVTDDSGKPVTAKIDLVSAQ